MKPEGHTMIPPPQRIQLRRTKGWRRPPNTVYVARPSRWGNPFPVGKVVNYAGFPNVHVRDRAHAVELYRQSIAGSPQFVAEVRQALRGRNLACWCPLVDAQGNRVPCHADVLLEVANDRQEVAS